MSTCLFCRIVAGEIPATKVYETPNVLAFRDINPRAPTHVLVIPKKHLATLNDLADEDLPLAGELLLAARLIAMQDGLTERGYRVVVNCNTDGGQEVYHVHLHVLGGRKLSWPPG